jgi:hypothetical protein
MDRLDHCHVRVEALEQQTVPLPQQTYTREAQTRGVARRRLTRLTPGLCTLLALSMVVGGFTPAAGQAISCGATLGPGGQFLLEADLDCGTVSPALTVRDGAQLDLGGHTISGGEGFSGGPSSSWMGRGPLSTMESSRVASLVMESVSRVTAVTLYTASASLRGALGSP